MCLGSSGLLLMKVAMPRVVGLFVGMGVPMVKILVRVSMMGMCLSVPNIFMRVALVCVAVAMVEVLMRMAMAMKAFMGSRIPYEHRANHHDGNIATESSSLRMQPFAGSHLGCPGKSKEYESTLQTKYSCSGQPMAFQASALGSCKPWELPSVHSLPSDPPFF